VYGITTVDTVYHSHYSI